MTTSSSGGRLRRAARRLTVAGAAASLTLLTGLVIAVLVMALGNGMGGVIKMTIGADLSPSIGRARFLGIWAIFTNIGRLGGPSLVSLLIVVSSLEAGIVAIGGITAAGAAWSATCWSP